jgi:HlyD family secretion protein
VTVLSNEVQVDSAPVDSTAAETKPASGVATQAGAEQLDAPAPASDPSKSDKPQDHSSRNRSPRRLKRSARLALILTVLAGLGVGIFLLKPGRLVSGAAASAEELKIAPRSFSIEINCPGTLRATSVQNYGGPPGFRNYWQFQIVSLVPEGTNVKRGDVLINFDAQKVNQDLQQSQNELEQATKELEKTRVQIDLDESDLAAKLAEAENKYSTLKLKQASIPSLEASIKIEEDRLALEEARQEVDLIKEWIDWHKKSSEATYKIIESKKARAEIKVAEIKKALENYQAKADRDGVAVYKLKWSGDRFQVGENVWSGQPVVEIPDLNTIIAEGFVPEVDIGKLRVGQRTEVAIDALPGKSYAGSVTGIGRLVHSKSWDVPNKILEAQIALDQLDTSVMRPAMSIKVKIETDLLSNVLVVPLKAVHQTGEGWEVKVRSNGSWRERSVRLGESNGTDVVILDGISSGELIAPDYGKAK